MYLCVIKRPLHVSALLPTRGVRAAPGERATGGAEAPPAAQRLQPEPWMPPHRENDSSTVHGPALGGWPRKWSAACAFVAVGAMGLASACQSSTDRPPGLTTGSPGGGASGASGGQGGTGGVGGSAGGGLGGAAGRGGTGATGGSAGAGGGAVIGEDDFACSGASVFLAAGMNFREATPAGLASELNLLAAAATSHPVTIVLAASGAKGEIMTSATELATNGLLQAFPAGKVPDVQPAAVFDGGFRNDAPHASAWMRFQQGQGQAQASDVFIALTKVNVDATTFGGCSSVTATLTAEIPASQANVALDLESGATTVGALAGGAGPWPVRAFFSGESVDFDYEALPEE